MIKRVLIVAGFVVFFVLMVAFLFYLQQKGHNSAAAIAEDITMTNNTISADSFHSYTAEDLSAECSTDDHIFCAVERVVKCTMTPELDGCSKENVPAFVIGKAQDTERPTEISFKIIKIKPVPESTDVSVYTESECNAMWFGLCKGTVVYSLTPRDGGDSWRVTNIYALEPVGAEQPVAEVVAEETNSEAVENEEVAESTEAEVSTTEDVVEEPAVEPSASTEASVEKTESVQTESVTETAAE